MFVKILGVDTSPFLALIFEEDDSLRFKPYTSKNMNDAWIIGFVVAGVY